MQPIKKVLVALDASHMDKTLISYTRFLLNVLEVEKLYFVSIIKNLNVPEEILKEYPDFIQKAIDDREKTIRETVSGICEECDVKADYVIKTEHPTSFIMEFADERDIDLIVLGRKLTMPTSSVTIPRLARRANTNLLIVPEGAKPRAEKFLVPIDFSEHSRMALQYAYDLSHKANDPHIICQHVYNIPTGYHYTGKSKREFGSIMKKNAEEAFNKFFRVVKKNEKARMNIYFDEDKNDDLTSDIRDASIKFQPDWVIIGAKGRTRAAALFIGSFAEKLLTSLVNVPLFVARPKGGNEGLIDYLKEL